MLIAITGAIIVRYHVVVLFSNLSFLNKKCMKNRGVELYSDSNYTRVLNTKGGVGNFFRNYQTGALLVWGGNFQVAGL